MFILFNSIALFLVSFLGLALVIAGLATQAGEPWMWGLSWPLLYLAYALGTFLPGLAVTVRRLHDTGRSGWWTLMALVPFGGIVILVFTVRDGQPHENQYGTNPAPAPQSPYPYQPGPYAHQALLGVRRTLVHACELGLQSRIIAIWTLNGRLAADGEAQLDFAVVPVFGPVGDHGLDPALSQASVVRRTCVIHFGQGTNRSDTGSALPFRAC